jgi:hypothetical protein
VKTPRSLQCSPQTLADFESAQEKLKQKISLSQHEQDVCKSVMDDRADVSVHNITGHKIACVNGDVVSAREFLTAFCIDPYRSVMLEDHKKHFGVTVLPNEQAQSMADEFNN